MLFIHHNQAQIRQRREHAQARADDEFGLARHGADEVMAARTGRRLAVQYRWFIAQEAAVDAREQLWCDVDLWLQHQLLLTARQYFGHGGKIHFGLAAASDAVQ